eukprot:jgi/Chrzof1/3438/Cz12g25130.t1
MQNPLVQSGKGVNAPRIVQILDPAQPRPVLAGGYNGRNLLRKLAGASAGGHYDNPTVQSGKGVNAPRIVQLLDPDQPRPVLAGGYNGRNLLRKLAGAAAGGHYDNPTVQSGKGVNAPRIVQLLDPDQPRPVLAGGYNGRNLLRKLAGAAAGGHYDNPTIKSGKRVNAPRIVQLLDPDQPRPVLAGGYNGRNLLRKLAGGAAAGHYDNPAIQSGKRVNAPRIVQLLDPDQPRPVLAGGYNGRNLRSMMSRKM